MITTYESDGLFGELNQAIVCALEGDELKGIWAQKHELDGEERWDFSCEEKISKVRLFTPFEEKGLFEFFTKIIEDELDEDSFWYTNIDDYESFVEFLEKAVQERWNEKDTIKTTKERFVNEYDMYGVRPSDFF